jgi:hypothetical protein
MTDYRRATVEGGCYFFTVVMVGWRTFLTVPPAAQKRPRVMEEGGRL